METRTINTNNSEKKNEMSKGQAAAASGIAGAAVGVGASIAYDAYGHPVEPTPGPVEPNPGPVEPTPGPDEPNPGPVEPNPDPVEPDPGPVEPDPSPVEPNPGPVEPTLGPVEPTPDPEGPNKVEDQPFTNPEQSGPDAIDPNPLEEIVQNGELDVDRIVDEIIAIEEVDPNDIDMEDLLVFEDVGVIYTEEGDIINVATGSDIYGEPFVLVDIDGDLYFDFATDENLNIVGTVDNHIAMGDVEIQIYDEYAQLPTDDATSEAIDQMDFTGDITT